MAKKIKRELDCVLDDKEKGELAVKASKNHNQARQKREEASALDKEAKAWDEQVDAGLAKRQVECIEIKDFVRNEIRIERTDELKYWPEGSPVVETRPMTGDERQLEIDGAADGGGAKVATKSPKGRGKKNAAPN